MDSTTFKGLYDLTSVYLLSLLDVHCVQGTALNTCIETHFILPSTSCVGYY